jgi:hypothetical protein
MLRTVMGYHWPPRAVRMPRLLSLTATSVRVEAPAALIDLMPGGFQSSLVAMITFPVPVPAYLERSNLGELRQSVSYAANR